VPQSRSEKPLYHPSRYSWTASLPIRETSLRCRLHPRPMPARVWCKGPIDRFNVADRITQNSAGNTLRHHCRNLEGGNVGTNLACSTGFGSAGLLASGGALGGASPVAADYGSGAQFQVEISANTLQIGFWLWAEPGPNQISDYEETDCIHLGGGPANDAAANDSGSLTSWSVSNGRVTMNGMKIISGLETASVSAPIGPNGTITSVTITVTSAIVPIIPVGASLTLPAAGVVAP
jgi:hypothetical protein